jgi:hypothetical protein
MKVLYPLRITSFIPRERLPAPAGLSRLEAAPAETHVSMLNQYRHPVHDGDGTIPKQEGGLRTWEMEVKLEFAATWFRH